MRGREKDTFGEIRGTERDTDTVRRTKATWHIIQECNYAFYTNCCKMCVLPYYIQKKESVLRKNMQTCIIHVVANNAYNHPKTNIDLQEDQ